MDVDVEVVGRTMRILYLFGAARRDASPAQIGSLKAVANLLKDTSVTLDHVESRVHTIMGADWVPDPEYAAAIEALGDDGF